LEHWPELGSQVPATWHWSDAEHTMGLLPVHVPLWQVSVCVQALPSLHVVPFGFGVATHRFVRPSEAHVPTLHASPSAAQSLSFVHKTAFTHSEGEEAGDDDGYEQTSMSSGALPLGKSPILTQHLACVSFVRQLVPVHTFPFLCMPVNTSATLLTVQADVAVIRLDPPQFSVFVSSHE
jgi:hypothetical protein